MTISANLPVRPPTSEAWIQATIPSVLHVIVPVGPVTELPVRIVCPVVGAIILLTKEPYALPPVMMDNTPPVIIFAHYVVPIVRPVVSLRLIVLAVVNH